MVMLWMSNSLNDASYTLHYNLERVEQFDKYQTMLYYENAVDLMRGFVYI